MCREYKVIIPTPIWVVVKTMVPFWVPILFCGTYYLGYQKGTLILTTTHFINSFSKPKAGLQVQGSAPGLREQLRAQLCLAGVGRVSRSPRRAEHSRGSRRFRGQGLGFGV